MSSPANGPGKGPPKVDFTILLRRIADGDSSAEAELMPHIYEELKKRASSCMNGERPGHSMQATELVHEVYLKLAGRKETDWKDRAHFFALAATMMKAFLVDHARRRHAMKRGGSALQRISLDENLLVAEERCTDVLIVNDLLDKLAAQDERQARIVEMRYFGGLSEEEIALLLRVSVKTVKRDWKMAKAWVRATSSSVEVS